MSKASKTNKVMTLKEAVARFVFDGALVGLGGQNISRCQMALVHEVIRQGKKELTLTGCNLSIQMDLLVAAGLVRRCECGGAGLERFGAVYSFKRAIEEGRMEIEDFSHSTMASRFLAGEMGIPFIPCGSLMGSDILREQRGATRKKHAIIDNPWNPGEKVLLLSAVTPDVALVHVQRADEIGNIVIEGISNHEPEMIRAARTCIVTCEEIVRSEETRRWPERTTVPYHYVDAVIEVPFGAYPTMTYRYYSYDAEHIRFYQACAREGGEAIRRYLDDYVYGCETFEDTLDRAGGIRRMLGLRRAMARITA
jgi:glutaconate CoA-transferase subunit A